MNFVFAIFRTHLLRLVSIDQISQKWHWRIHTSELSSRSYLQWRKKNIKFSRDCEVLPNLLAQFFGGLDKHLWAFVFVVVHNPLGKLYFRLWTIQLQIDRENVSFILACIPIYRSVFSVQLFDTDMMDKKSKYFILTSVYKPGEKIQKKIDCM